MLPIVTSHVTSFFAPPKKKCGLFLFWVAQGVGARSGFWQEEEKGDFLLIMVKR